MEVISVLNGQCTWSPILSVNMFNLLIDRNYLRVCFIDSFGESANGTPKPTSSGIGEAKISKEEKRKARVERFVLPKFRNLFSVFRFLRL